MHSTLRVAAVLALSVSLWGFAIPAVAAAPTVAESAPRAFFNPDAVLDTSRIEDLRHVSAEVSDMYAQGLSWTDPLPLDQYGWESPNAFDCPPAECLAAALESQGWFVRYDVATDRLLAFPPSRP